MAPITDKQLESAIADMLRFGVVLAAIVVFLGGGIYLRHPSIAPQDYSHFRATLPSLCTAAGALRGALQLDAKSVIQLGILILIATPVARVIFCVIGFFRQRDGLYIGVSMTVFIILIYSLFRGGR
jgi:uncharacterized membrane protein